MSTPMSNIDLPGFADPVAEAQASFRALLDAMSRPGTIATAGTGLTPPAPLDPATAAVLLALVDGDARLHIAPDCAASRDWLVFHCSATPSDDIATAAFVVAKTMPDLSHLATGTDEAPESAATLVLQVPALGSGPAFQLSGPGLKAPTIFRAEGLPSDFAARWAANHALFPRGIDLVLCAGTTLAAIPRSITVTEA
jgi:alpha-D-ribose 1-methylphosphonate 5-triphosphate synthase subunit PhnH